MTESSAPGHPELRWEQKVLDALGFLRWPGLRSSPTRVAAFVLAVAVVSFGPRWLAIPVGTALVPLVLAYWVAFAVKVVRQFSVGYRENR